MLPCLSVSNNNTEYAAGEITSLFHGIQKTHRALGCYSFSIREPIPSDRGFSVRPGLCLSFLHSFIVPGTVLSMADRQGKSPKNAFLLGPEKVKSVFSHKLGNLRMKTQSQEASSRFRGHRDDGTAQRRPFRFKDSPKCSLLVCYVIQPWPERSISLAVISTLAKPELFFYPSEPGEFPFPPGSLLAFAGPELWVFPARTFLLMKCP